MKNIRIGLTICMLMLTGLAWATQAGSAVKTQAACRDAVDEARELMERKLYQKAIASLEEALAILEDADTRRLWRDASRMAYEDGVLTSKKYISAMETVAALQPDNVENWEELIGFCLEQGDYTTAYACCVDSEEAGVDGEALQEYRRQARYAYRSGSKVFTQVLQSPGGYSAVCDGSRWGILDEDGGWETECEYDMLSPLGAGMDRLTGIGENRRIVDGDKVVQSFFPETAEALRAVGDGILPVLNGGSWRYYDSLASGFIPGSYEDASSFQGGAAAVKENGSWTLVGRDGTSPEDAAFEDIKLYGSGEYLWDGMFVAKSGGSYGLYNQKAELVAGIDCTDMDAYYGGGIAYRDPGGKWGFMSRKGEVMIEPRFEGAKSFSNGLAAVCEDGRWGFIDSSGKLAIDCQFLDAGYFTAGGVCFVSQLAGEYYIINLRFPEGT